MQKTKPSPKTKARKKTAEDTVSKLNTLQIKEYEGLTNQQKAFCDYYLEGYSALKSASMAGYAQPNPEAYQLLKNPRIGKYLQLRKKMKEVRTDWNADRVIYELSDLYSDRKKEKSYTGAVKALEMLGREVGLWNEKKVKIEHTKVESILDKVEAEVIDITAEVIETKDEDTISDKT